MRLSAFWTLMDDEFGPVYSRSLAKDLHLSALGSRTPEQALAEGVDPRDVWAALCDAQDVPPERRLGRDRPPRR